MILISASEFEYLMKNGKMYKYLRFFNQFSKTDEPIMMIDGIDRKRCGFVKTALHCIIQGKSQLNSLDKFVKETPYKDSQDWMNVLTELYRGAKPDNGYIFLLEINRVSVSIPKYHPSCNGCVKVNTCDKYVDLVDPNYCEFRVTKLDLVEPELIIKSLRSNLNDVNVELNKLRDLDNRNDIIIKVTGLMEDIRRYLNK